MSEQDVITFARFAAKSALSISFDKTKLVTGIDEDGNTTYANGMLLGETVYVNPESKLKYDVLLSHEMFHKLFREKASWKLIKSAIKHMDVNKQREISARYEKYYKKINHGEFPENFESIVIDEIAAHYTETVFSDIDVLAYLTEEQPTIKDKIMGFFNKSARTYADDSNLSSAARKFARQYRKLFQQVADRDYQSNSAPALALSVENGEENPVTSTDVDTDTRYAINFLSEEDLPGYLRAGGRANKYKQQAIDNGKKIILTTSEDIREYIEKAIAGEKDLPAVAYGKVDSRLSEETSDYSDGKIQISNYYLELVATDIHHAYQEHLHAKKAGDIDLSIEDFMNIPLYVATYDDFVYAIKYKSGNTKICLSKKISDGRVLVIETVSKSHGSIEFKNMIGVSEEKYLEEYEKKYKKRNGTNTGGSKSSNNSPRDETASNIIIPENSEKSNSFSKKSLENSSEERFSLAEDTETIENYTEEQYNNFGWARYAEGISKSELDDVYSKIKERSTLRTFKQSSKGEAIIEVNNDPHKTLGVNNVFVFVNGTKNNFYINRVVRFSAETETEMEIIKEVLYEGRTCSDTHLAFLEQKGFAKQYTREGSKSFVEYKRLRDSGKTSGGIDTNNRGRKKYRSGYSLSVGEDGEIIERYSLPEDEDFESPTVENVAKQTEKDNSIKGRIKSFKKNFFTAKDRLYIDTVDEMYGIQKYLDESGDKNAKARIQQARASRSQAQTMIGSVQYDVFSEETKKIGDGIHQIMKPIRSRGKNNVKKFEDYMLHRLNIDRMTLEERSLEWTKADREALEAIKEDITKRESEITRLEQEAFYLGNSKEDMQKKEALHSEIESLAEENRKSEREAKKLEAKIKERLLENKPIFGENENRASAITAEESRKIVKKYESVHPDWNETAEKIYTYLRALNHMRVEAGLITAEQEAYMNELYPHYVPAYRDFSYSGIGAVKGSRNLEVSKTVKKAKGGGQDISEFEQSIAEQTEQLMRAGRINQLANAIYEAATASNDDTYVEIVSRQKLNKAEAANLQTESVEVEQKNKNNQITFYKDGEKITMNVSREIFLGFEALTKPTYEFDSTILNLAAKANRGFKKLVTSYNPAFAARNIIRDAQDAGLNSKHPALLAKNVGVAIAQMLKNSDKWQLYRAYGGWSSTVFDANGFNGEINSRGFDELRKLLDIKDGVSIKDVLMVLPKAGKDILIGIENVNAFVEQITRFAEFLASIEAGDSVETAIYNSAEVTTNFGRRGRITKVLNATFIPFLNPAIQGFDKMFRNVKDAVTGEHIVRAIATLLAKATIIGIVPMIINMLMYSDDEDYEELREEDKENNFLVKLPNGTFIKIPRGRVASVIGGAVNRTVRVANGKDADIEGYFENVISQVTPIENFSRSILSPFSDVANNTTWYGTEIEGRQFENTPPKDRYDESTSTIAVAIGQKINRSPKKIHYLLDQYLGVIGDFVLPATTPKAEVKELSWFTGNFTIDPATSNKLSADFYEIYEKAQYAKTAGDDTAIYQVRYLNKVKDAVSEMYKQISEIQNSNLSSAEKLQQTRVIRILINEAYRTAKQDFGLYTKAIEATASIKLPKDVSEQTFQNVRFTEATRLMYGAKKALSEYDEKVYGKSTLFNKAGLSYDDYYSYYFTTRWFDSDKDKNGETVSGSKRKKIVTAINSLKISRNEKLLLIASNGYSLSDKDKKQLLQYIFKQKMTKAEKQELAEECGFKVKNGKIILK